jgi:hypothetical protein
MVSQLFTRTARLGKRNAFALRALTLTALFSIAFGAARTASAQAPPSAEHPALLPAGAALGAPAARPADTPNYVFLDAAPTAPAEQAAKPEGGGGDHEGIKLHGHWEINVKNADGTPAQHRVFENQLQYDGTQYLTALISGWGVAGDYAIYFTNATATSTGNPNTDVVCPAPSSTTTSTFPYCSIVQNVNTQPGIFHCMHYVCVGGLTETPTFGSGTGLPNVQMAGSITAPQAGAIVNVYVGFAGCNIVSATTPPPPTGPATITPVQCEASITDSYGGTMSGTTITPITVIGGQIIQITVTFTFS